MATAKISLNHNFPPQQQQQTYISIPNSYPNFPQLLRGFMAEISPLYFPMQFVCLTACLRNRHTQIKSGFFLLLRHVTNYDPSGTFQAAFRAPTKLIAGWLGTLYICSLCLFRFSPKKRRRSNISWNVISGSFFSLFSRQTFYDCSLLPRKSNLRKKFFQSCQKETLVSNLFNSSRHT